MQSGQDDIENKRRTSIRNFIVAYGFLFIGSLLKGADGAFFTLGIAGAAFFLFLALLNYPYKSIEFRRQASPKAEVPPVRTRGSQIVNLFHSIKAAFKQKGHSSSASPAKANPARFVGCMFIGLMVFFFVILFFSIDSEEFSDADLIVQSADQWSANGEYDSAQKYYRMALGIEPENGPAYRGLGKVQMGLQQYDSASLYFDQALRIDESDEQSLYGKALSYFSKDMYRESLDTNFEILRNNSTSVDANLLVGDCYFFLLNYDSAVHYYENGYDAGARYPLLMQRLGICYEKLEDYDLAVDYYEESLTVDSTMTEVYERLIQIGPLERREYYGQRLQQLRQDSDRAL